MQICLSPHDMIASEAGDVEAMVHYLVSGFRYTRRVLEVLLTRKQAGTGIIKMTVKGPFAFQILRWSGGRPAKIRQSVRPLAVLWTAVPPRPFAEVCHVPNAGRVSGSSLRYLHQGKRLVRGFSWGWACSTSAQCPREHPKAKPIPASHPHPYCRIAPSAGLGHNGFGPAVTGAR